MTLTEGDSRPLIRVLEARVELAAQDCRLDMYVFALLFSAGTSSCGEW
jgi:hypothetical protein